MQPAPTSEATIPQALSPSPVSPASPDNPASNINPSALNMQQVDSEPQSSPVIIQQAGISPTTNKGSKYSSVEQRTLLWKQRVDDKKRAMQEIKSSKALEGCTFKPFVFAKEEVKDAEKGGSVSESSMKSVEKYIKKQQAIRLTKQEIDKKAEMMPGSGKNIASIYFSRQTLEQEDNDSQSSYYRQERGPHKIFIRTNGNQPK